MLELFPYQDYGANWLAGRKYALLADEMRVGKSPQSVTACDIIGAQKVTVLCPASARANWLKEFSKWSIFSRDSQAIYTSDQMILSTTGASSHSNLTICSYDLANQSNILSGLRSLGPDVLILDEGHYLKSAGAQRTQNVFGLHGLAQTAKRVWSLTGTPMPNGSPAELWVLLHVFGVYRGKYDSFLRRFCTGYWEGNTFKPTGVKNEDSLNELLSQVMLRRTMKEVRPEVPEEIFNDVLLHSADSMSTEELAADAHVQAILKQLPEDQWSEALMELDKDHIATLRRWTGLAKVKPVVEYIRQEFAEGVKKAVIFALHTEVVDSLRACLSNMRPLVIDGRVPGNRRQEIIDQFREDPKRRIIIGQIQAAKENIDLTPANNIYFAESSWVPGDNAQAAKRCSNVNKLDVVEVRMLALAGSSDELVQRAHVRKLETINKVVGD